MSGPTDLKLERLAASRRHTLEAHEAAHRALLNAVLERLEAEPDTNVRALARDVGLAHGTVYNELARHQDRADQLSTNGDIPAAAPHDDDRATALEPTVRLSDTMRRVLRILAHPVEHERWRAQAPQYRRTVEALRERGLVEREALDITRAGREVIERGDAA